VERRGFIQVLKRGVWGFPLVRTLHGAVEAVLREKIGEAGAQGCGAQSSEVSREIRDISEA